MYARVSACISMQLCTCIHGETCVGADPGATQALQPALPLGPYSAAEDPTAEAWRPRGKSCRTPREAAVAESSPEEAGGAA